MNEFVPQLLLDQRRQAGLGPVAKIDRSPIEGRSAAWSVPDASNGAHYNCLMIAPSKSILPGCNPEE